MLVVAAYDISDDRRRLRVHKALKNFGKPVQYSTFECLLDTAELARLQHTLGRLTAPDDDQVAYYTLCEACAQQTDVICGVPRVHEPRIRIV
jgi:CRISPR-associated protein Cas2